MELGVMKDAWIQELRTGRLELYTQEGMMDRYKSRIRRNNANTSAEDMSGCSAEVSRPVTVDVVVSRQFRVSDESA